MQKISFLLFLCSVIVFIGCKGDKKKAEHPEINIQPMELIPEIKEIQGIIGEGTSMHTIELLTEQGDTLYISNQEQTVLGGLTVGDKMNIVYTAKGDTLSSITAVNITTLAHLWSQLDDYGNEQTLELTPDGEAYTVNMSSLNYDSWQIKDGSLLLHSPAQAETEMKEYTDTFTIKQLTDRLLIMSSGELETMFER